MPEVSTKTATSTKVGVTVALIGAVAMAAAGVVGMSSAKRMQATATAKISEAKIEKQAEARTLATDYLDYIENESKGVVINARATRTVRADDTVDSIGNQRDDKKQEEKKENKSAVKRVEFVSEIDHNITQTNFQLTKFASWPLRGDGHPEQTLLERQNIEATRIQASEIDNPDLVRDDSADQKKDDKKKNDKTNQRDDQGAVGSILLLNDPGKKKEYSNPAKKPLDAYPKEANPYQAHVKVPLASKLAPRDAIKNLINATINTEPYGTTKLNPNEEMLSGSLGKKDVAEFLFGVTGMGWYEIMPAESAKPYRVDLVFGKTANNGIDHNLHRVWITGSDFDVLLHFASKPYIHKIDKWVDYTIMQTVPYFRNISATGVNVEDYSMKYLANVPAEVDRWYYHSKKEPVGPVDDGDTYDPGTGQTDNGDTGGDDTTNGGNDTAGDDTVDDTTGADSDLSDLSIYSIEFDAQDLLTIDVNNKGAADVAAESVVLSIWYDGVLKWTYNTKTWNCQDFMKAGKYCEIQPSTKEAILGAANIKACIDSTDKETEFDETNNCLLAVFDENHDLDYDEYTSDDPADDVDDVPTDDTAGDDPTDDDPAEPADDPVDDPVEVTCTDTDKNNPPTLDEFEKGTATYSEADFTDYCYIDPLTDVEVPECNAQMDPNCKLREYVCLADDSMRVDVIDCAAAGRGGYCQLGACSQVTDTPEVTTGDPGTPVTGNPFTLTGVNTYTVDGDFNMFSGR